MRRQAIVALGREPALLEEIFDAIPVLLVLWEARLRRFTLNRCAQEVLGWTNREANAGDLMVLIYPDAAYRGEVAGYMRSLAPGWREWEAVSRSGERIAIEWANVRLRGAGMLGIGVDLRSRRQAEAALEGRVRERTVELEFRSGQLAALAMELSRAEEQERHRLAEVLHDDLQQMLVAAQFQLDGLRRKVGHGAGEQFARFSSLLSECVQKTRTLSQELSPPTLRQQGLLSALAWEAGQMRARHGLEVELELAADAEPVTDGLKPFLYKAVRELLFNTVKHSGVRRASVRMRRQRRRLEVTVSDEGKGFSGAAQEEVQGFGLLGIRERVMQMGGRMEVESEPGRGCRFVLEVPDEGQGEHGLAGRGESSAGRPLAMRGGRRGSDGGEGGLRLRVVLADDHRSVREGLALLLSGQGDLEVVGEADNGKQAVDIVHDVRPDVVVMDASMPVMNGEDATRLIKRQYPGVRVVALSMYEQEDVARAMLDAGAEAYLTKSGPSERLLEAIRGEGKVKSQKSKVKSTS